MADSLPRAEGQDEERNGQTGVDTNVGRYRSVQVVGNVRWQRPREGPRRKSEWGASRQQDGYVNKNKGIIVDCGRTKSTRSKSELSSWTTQKRNKQKDATTAHADTMHTDALYTLPTVY